MKSIFVDIFNDEFDTVSTSAKINSDKKLNIVEFATVHREDSEPVSMISPNLKQGPWIAGGACLRWYQSQPVGDSDIDVFCKDAAQAQTIINEIKSYGRFTVKFESENAVTLEHHCKESWTKSWTIQIITRRYFTSLQEVIDSFDITVCEIGTDGNLWLLNATTAKDIRERNLRFKQPLQPDAPKRLTKYWTYGYRPVEGTLDSIIANPDTRWGYTSDEDYQNAF